MQWVLWRTCGFLFRTEVVILLHLSGVLAAEDSCLISSLEFALGQWELSYSRLDP